ncbi:MAG: nucleoside deaminase [Acholeplasma sp.]|nr:nucleoside deaminase [Acholeplasma sp.]
MNEKHYFNESYKEAVKAFNKGEVPVGAVVVFEDKIIARAHNNREAKQSFKGHAEFLAMEKAAKKIGSWRLEDCDVYVTMEPCPMCAGAMIQARVRKCYYSSFDLKNGVANSIINLFDLPFNHHVHCEYVDDQGKSEQLVKTFFKKLRKKD